MIVEFLEVWKYLLCEFMEWLDDVSWHFQILRTNFSLEVHWDGDNTVDVLIDETFKNRTCGLCGNFNDDLSDDFKNPNGTLVSILNLANYKKSYVWVARKCKKLGILWAVNWYRCIILMSQHVIFVAPIISVYTCNFLWLITLAIVVLWLLLVRVVVKVWYG